MGETRQFECEERWSEGVPCQDSQAPSDPGLAAPLPPTAPLQQGPGAVVPDEQDDLLIWVVKGNLRHRINKCGLEIIQIEAATDCQRRLRQIASEQHIGEGKLARPTWANGAFVFVTQQHAAVIQERLEGWMQAEGRTFMSKYVFVSASLKDVVAQAMDRQEAPEGMTGKERFEWLKSGRIEEEIRIKAVRTMEEVERTSLRELAEFLQRDAAKRPPAAALAAATPGPAQATTPPKEKRHRGYLVLAHRVGRLALGLGRLAS